MVESMNAKFLELDATNPVVPYNDIGVKSPKTISLSLPILVVSVSRLLPTNFLESYIYSSYISSYL